MRGGCAKERTDGGAAALHARLGRRLRLPLRAAADAKQMADGGKDGGREAPGWTSGAGAATCHASHDAWPADPGQGSLPGRGPKAGLAEARESEMRPGNQREGDRGEAKLGRGGRDPCPDIWRDTSTEMSRPESLGLAERDGGAGLAIDTSWGARQHPRRSQTRTRQGLEVHIVTTPVPLPPAACLVSGSVISESGTDSFVVRWAGGEQGMAGTSRVRVGAGGGDETPSSNPDRSPWTTAIAMFPAMSSPARLALVSSRACYFEPARRYGASKCTTQRD